MIRSLKDNQVAIRKSSIHLEPGQVWQAAPYIYSKDWIMVTAQDEKRQLQPCEKFIIAKPPRDPNWYLDGDQVSIMLVDGQQTKLPRWAFERDQFLQRID